MASRLRIEQVFEYFFVGPIWSNCTLAALHYLKKATSVGNCNEYGWGVGGGTPSGSVAVVSDQEYNACNQSRESKSLGVCWGMAVSSPNYV
jgi:hypothetical protein